MASECLLYCCTAVLIVVDVCVPGGLQHRCCWGQVKLSVEHRRARSLLFKQHVGSWRCLVLLVSRPLLSYFDVFEYLPSKQNSFTATTAVHIIYGMICIYHSRTHDAGVLYDVISYFPHDLDYSV